MSEGEGGAGRGVTEEKREAGAGSGVVVGEKTPWKWSRLTGTGLGACPALVLISFQPRACSVLPAAPPVTGRRSRSAPTGRLPPLQQAYRRKPWVTQHPEGTLALTTNLFSFYSCSGLALVPGRHWLGSAMLSIGCQGSPEAKAQSRRWRQRGPVPRVWQSPGNSSRGWTVEGARPLPPGRTSVYRG